MISKILLFTFYVGLATSMLYSSAQANSVINIYINRDLTATVDMKLEVGMFFFEKNMPKGLLPKCFYDGSFNLSLSGDYLTGTYEIRVTPEVMGNLSPGQIRAFLSSFDEVAFFELMRLLYMPEGASVSNINKEVKDVDGSVYVLGYAEFRFRSVYVKELRGSFSGYLSKTVLKVTYNIEAELSKIEKKEGSSIIVDLKPIIDLLPPNTIGSLKLWYPPDTFYAIDVTPNNCLKSYGMIEWYYVFTDHAGEYSVKFKVIGGSKSLFYVATPIVVVVAVALFTLRPWNTIKRRISR